MNREKLYEYFKGWLAENSIGDIKAQKLFDTAEIIDVKETQQSDGKGINENYELIVLPCESSKTGIPKLFMFRSIDTVAYNEDGDVESAITTGCEVI